MVKKKNKDKVPLMLFSGGMDSTYLLHTLLAKGDVDVLYVKGGQAADKITQELAVRKRIIWKLEQLTGNRVRYDHHVSTDQLFAGMPNYSWCQPAMWMTGALHHVDSSRHSKLVIGYVSDDGIISRLHNIKRAWHHLQMFSKHSKPVPVEFPLHTTSKQSIMKMMDVRMWDYIWVCEMPIDKEGVTSACGNCVPCLTQHGQLAIYEKANGRTYREYIDNGVKQWEADDKRKAEDAFHGPMPLSNAVTDGYIEVSLPPSPELDHPASCLRLEKSA